MILYFPKPELRSKKMFRSDISLPKLTKKHHFFGEGFPSNRRVVGWEFPIPRCHGNFWPTCSPRNSILLPNNGGFPKNQKKAGEIFVFFFVPNVWWNFGNWYQSLWNNDPPQVFENTRWAPTSLGVTTADEWPKINGLTGVYIYIYTYL